MWTKHMSDSNNKHKPRAITTTHPIKLIETRTLDTAKHTPSNNTRPKRQQVTQVMIIIIKNNNGNNSPHRYHQANIQTNKCSDYSSILPLLAPAGDSRREPRGVLQLFTSSGANAEGPRGPSPGRGAPGGEGPRRPITGDAKGFLRLSQTIDIKGKSSCKKLDFHKHNILKRNTEEDLPQPFTNT